MTAPTETASELIDYCMSGDRVCPRGDKWHALWQLLPEDESKSGRERRPPLPLILAASSCEDWEKRLRLKDHIVWADAQGVIEQVDEFLRGLSADEWEHSATNVIKDDFYDTCSFVNCIDDDDVEGMKFYLARGIDPNARCAEYSDGNALARAAEAGALKAVTHLLSIGVELDAAAVGIAAVRGYTEVLEGLLAGGVMPDADALCSVAGTGNLKILERLLQAGAPVNGLTSYGWYALHNAVVEDQTKIVELLLLAGANPNLTTSDGTTPLMLAVRGGDSAIPELLLKHGAAP